MQNRGDNMHNISFFPYLFHFPNNPSISLKYILEYRKVFIVYSLIWIHYIIWRGGQRSKNAQ